MAASVYIIAAIDENNAIGIANKLPWHLPEDLKRFKDLTEDSPIIMGRKTYDSLGSKPLPNRPNIVITNNPEKLNSKGIIIASSLKQALKIAKKITRDQIFIIGGAQIFKEGIAEADGMYITLVKGKFKDTDCFFPKISAKYWKKISEGPEKESKGGIKFQYIEYERISNKKE